MPKKSRLRLATAVVMTASIPFLATTPVTFASSTSTSTTGAAQVNTNANANTGPSTTPNSGTTPTAGTATNAGTTPTAGTATNAGPTTAGPTTNADTNTSIGSIQITSGSSVKAGYQSATVLVTAETGITFASDTTVTLDNSVNGLTDLTKDTTVNSPSSLSIQLPSGDNGIGAGTYTLTVSSGGTSAAATLTVTPYTDTSSVQWDGIYTDISPNYVSVANPTGGQNVTIGMRAFSGNLTNVVLNAWDTALNKGFQVTMQPGKTFGPYQLWTATVPASSGGTIYYRFDINAGNSFACLSGDGLHTWDDTNQNFPLPVGSLTFSKIEANQGDMITANDPVGDFSGSDAQPNSTMVQFVDASGKVVATAPGTGAGWSSVNFQVPSNLADGTYTVHVLTVAKDADGVVNVQFDRTSTLIVGPLPEWMKDFEHNSYSTFYRSPFGAVAQNTPITLRLRGPKDLKDAAVRLWGAKGQGSETDLPMQPLSMSAADIEQQTGVADASAYSWWTVMIPASDVTTPGTMWYQFQTTIASGQTVYYDDNGSQLEGEGQVGFGDGGPSYQISVYQQGYQTPDWLKHAVIYEVMPDRFYNGNIANDENPNTQKGIYTDSSGKESLGPIQFHQNWNDKPYDPNVSADAPNASTLRGNGQWNIDFFGGDLAGVNDKLDYLKSLGVNTLYLMPVFQAESNHKYDTGNFMEIDPSFGTQQDWLNLAKAAHAKGFHLILDGVFEDTGSDSVYFNKFGNNGSNGAWQAYQQGNPSLSPYYNWYQWTGQDSSPYQGWWGIDTLPQTNTGNPSFQQFIYGGPDSVAKHWLGAGGSDGWRLDSADNGNYNTAWWSNFRDAVKSVDENAAIVGEIWNNATNDNGTDWLSGLTFDSVMNYQFRNAVIDFFRGTYNDGSVQHHGVDAAGFNEELMRLYSEYPLQSFYSMMNLVDSQDTMRILTMLEGAPEPGATSATAQAQWKPDTNQQKTGVAKLGLVSDLQFAFPGAPTIWYGDEAGQSGYSDPLNRATYPWGKENETLLNHYRKLGAIRQANPVLQTGDFTPLCASGSVYAFARTITGGKDVFGSPAANAAAVVALNNQDSSTTVTIPLDGKVADGQKLYDALNNQWYTVENGSITMTLGSYQGALLLTPSTAPMAYMQVTGGGAWTADGPTADGLQTTSSAGQQTQIAWTPVPGATGYQVWMEDVNGHLRPVRHGLGADTTSLNVEPSNVATTYYVEALFGSGLGHPGGVPNEDSNSSSAVSKDALQKLSTSVTVPALNIQMGAVQASSVNGTVTLKWSSVDGAASYAIYQQQADGSFAQMQSVPAPDGGANPTSSAHTVQVNLSVPAGSASVTYRVAAINVDGDSVSSAVTVNVKP